MKRNFLVYYFPYEHSTLLRNLVVESENKESAKKLFIANKQHIYGRFCRIEDITEDIFDVAKAYISKYNKGKDNHYHNTKHLFFVFYASMKLFDKYQTKNKLSEHTKQTLGLVALFHDFNHSGGRLKDIDNIKIAFKELCKFVDQYEIDIDKDEAKEIMFVTEYPFTYKEEDLNILQRIILDADIMGVILNTRETTINLSKELNINIHKFINYQKNEFIKNLNPKLDYTKKLFDENKEKIIQEMDDILMTSNKQL